MLHKDIIYVLNYYNLNCNYVKYSSGISYELGFGTWTISKAIRLTDYIKY